MWLKKPQTKTKQDYQNIALRIQLKNLATSERQQSTSRNKKKKLSQ